LFSNYLNKKIAGYRTEVYGDGVGTGTRLRVSRERGGDGKKNYNAGWEWGQFFKCGVGMGTNFCPRIML